MSLDVASEAVRQRSAVRALRTSIDVDVFLVEHIFHVQLGRQLARQLVRGHQARGAVGFVRCSSLSFGYSLSKQNLLCQLMPVPTLRPGFTFQALNNRAVELGDRGMSCWPRPLAGRGQQVDNFLYWRVCMSMRPCSWHGYHGLRYTGPPNIAAISRKSPWT